MGPLEAAAAYGPSRTPVCLHTFQTVYMSREGNSLLKGSWTTGEVDTKRVQKNQVDSIGVEIEC